MRKDCLLSIALLPLFILLSSYKQPDNCVSYLFQNDFKRIKIKICGESLFYEAWDDDIGPFADTCKVRFSGDKVIIVKWTTHSFNHRKLNYRRNRQSLLLVDGSGKKKRKLEIPIEENYSE